MEDFPANSHKAKEEKKASEKKVEKIVTGKVVERKRSFGSKVKEVFIGGDSRAAASYIVAEVLLPALRRTIVEATTQGVERMIYGDSAPRRSASGGSTSRVQYNSPINRYSPQAKGFLPGESSRVRPNGRKDASEYVMETQEEAELVVETLGNVIEQFEFATLEDLKELLGQPTSFVDTNWGWSSLAYVDIRRVRDGWLVTFPPVEHI